MSPEEMRQKAMDLFQKRFHCSQAVLAVGQEKLDMVNEDVVKAMGSFGGGIASSGRVCGALIGGVALISSMYSRGNLSEKEDPRMWLLSRKLTKIFEEITEPYGGVNCRDIAQVDWHDHKAVKDFYTNPESRRKACIQIVGDVAYALGELLEQDAATQKPSA
jgi:C_GCAxxG_C_C family probable redox protein